VKIKDLRNGMKRVGLTAKITSAEEERKINSRYKDETYTVKDFYLGDETGTIKLSLWNEQIGQVDVGDEITITNGYVTAFRGEIQMNVGKYGTFSVQKGED
jgi:replication factor A1